MKKDTTIIAIIIIIAYPLKGENPARNDMPSSGVLHALRCSAVTVYCARVKYYIVLLLVIMVEGYFRTYLQDLNVACCKVGCLRVKVFRQQRLPQRYLHGRAEY